MLYDHVDFRVTDLNKVRGLYDALLPELGFTSIDEDDENVNYHESSKSRQRPFFGLMLDRNHRPNGSRLAFRASSREEVDRLAEIARAAGALAFEAPEIYDADYPWYYATFFEDADGNKLEICYRE